MNFHQAPQTFIRQVYLKVSDFERSLKFYQSIIGFQILEQVNEKKAVLTADGKTPLLILEQPDPVELKQGRTTGLYHFALLLPRRSDLANILQYFIQIGLPLQGASDHLVSEALYLADPDGNGIEIYTDRDDDTWVWNNGEVHMTTEPLDVQDLLSEVKGNWNGLPSGTVMGHIHLHVSELEKTKEFYCKGLGFDIVCKYGNQALFISTGGYHHHIGLNTWNGVGAPKPSEASVGLKWFTLVYPDEENLQNVLEQLRKIGAKIEDQNGGYFTEDPSGNRIELIVG